MLHAAPPVAAGLTLVLGLLATAGPPSRVDVVLRGAQHAVSAPAVAGVEDPQVPGTVRYRPPLDPPVLTARFSRPAHRWGPGHRGVDLAATTGQAVHAPADGTVTFSGRVVDRGVLVLTHPDGLRSSLEPVDDGLAVGTEVRAGDGVAVVGRGGHCASGCLHWGVRQGSTYLDPLDLLPGSGPVVLLPRG